MKQWKWHTITDVLRMMFRGKLHKAERRRFLLVLPTHPTRTTPLGSLSYRVVNPDASLEAGIARARMKKSYIPRVEEE